MSTLDALTLELFMTAENGAPLGGGYLIGVCGPDFKEFERMPRLGGRFSPSMWALQDQNNSATGSVLDAGSSRKWIIGSAYGNMDAIGVSAPQQKKNNRVEIRESV
eukprot:733000-Rhodomonas_salina.5